MMKTREPKDLLREARKRSFKSAAAAADACGMPAPTLRSYENGSRPITIEAARIFQDAFGVDAKSLVPERIEGLAFEGSTAEPEVIGDAAVGLWRDNTLDSSSGAITRPRTTIASRTKRRRNALRIKDDSMNRVFQQGWYAIFEEPESEDIRDYPEHTLVVIDRTRGNLTERSIRRIEKTSKDQCTLGLYSTEKKFAEKIAFPPKSKTETITLIGVVTGGSFDIE